MPLRLTPAAVPASATRRALLQSALASGAALALPPFAWTAGRDDAGKGPLITKPIPRSGERVPVIGLGTIWYRDANYATLKPVIERFLQLGGALIDTAAAYGESEGVIGRALEELKLRERAFLASKYDAGRSAAAPTSGPGSGPDAPRLSQFGPGPGGVEGPPPGIMRPVADGVGGAASFERSLQRLRTTRLDLLQVHNMADAELLLPQALEWKRAGQVRYVGVSAAAANPARLAEVLKAFPVDFVQLDYSLGNRAAEQGALQLCLEQRAAVLVNLPLARNTLLRKAASQPLPDWVAEFGIRNWPQYFLKYVVSHAAVTCAIPGTTSVAHLEDNLDAARGRLPDESQRRRMAEYWDALA